MLDLLQGSGADIFYIYIQLEAFSVFRRQSSVYTEGGVYNNFIWNTNGPFCNGGGFFNE